MKTITICGKEYEIKCNAFTHIQFKKIFNRGLFEDIDIIDKFNKLQVLLTTQILEQNPKIQDDELIKQLSRSMLPNIDEYIDAVTRIAYICIFTANEKIENYEEWLKNIPKLNTNDLWIAEVTEYAVSCFC